MLILNRTELESPAREGNSPLCKEDQYYADEHPSTTGHVEPCWNLRGPPRKAKYYSATDSEQVP